MAQGPSSLLIVALVAVVIIGAGSASAYLYVHNKPTGPPPTLLVKLYDNVTVNYIGIFGSGPQQGKVFDTSLYSVGSNGAAYPKSLGYQSRGAASSYAPLYVHVGGNTPSSGYSYGGKSYIQVVTGFWEGLLGLQGNLTHVISVPPPLGYGASDPSCIHTLPLSVHVPIFSKMTGLAFSAAYPGVLATTGATFNDPKYGWPVLILSANQSSVSIENLAEVGWTTTKAGWPVTVINMTTTSNGSGDITVRNELSPSDAGSINGHSSTGVCASSGQGSSGGRFIIAAVDLVHGTFTEDFNSETKGVILLFVVTVVDIHRPVSSLV